MPRASRFFRWVWRINGILLLVLSLITMLFALNILLSFVDPPQVVAVAPKPKDDNEPVVRLGKFTPVRGTNWVIAPLHFQSEEPSSRFSSTYKKYGGAILDYQFVDTNSGASWRLTGSAHTRILNQWLLSPESDGPVSLIAATVVQEDTDQDGQITAEDERVLIVVKPDGSARAEVLRGVDRVVHNSIRDSELHVLYVERETQRLLLMKVDVATLALLTHVEVTVQ